MHEERRRGLDTLGADPDPHFRPSARLAAHVIGGELDRPIVPVLNALWRLGISTAWSCAGHLDSPHVPYVSVDAPDCHAVAVLRELAAQLPGSFLDLDVFYDPDEDAVLLLAPRQPIRASAAVLRRRRRTCSTRIDAPIPNCGSDDLARQGYARPGVARRCCKRCGTVFSRERVLAAFDYFPGASGWHVASGEDRLRRWREAIRAAARAMPATKYLCVLKVFRAAGVPISVRMYSDRAGLRAIIEDVAQQRGLLLERRSIDHYPPTRRAEALRNVSKRRQALAAAVVE